MYAPSLLFFASQLQQHSYTPLVLFFFWRITAFPCTDYRVRCTPTFTILYYCAPNIYKNPVLLYIVIAHHAIEQLGPSGYVGVKMQ